VGADRADSVHVFRGDETGWARVLEAARTGSLFSPRRAIVVRNADALKGEGDEAVAYLADPSPDAALILLASKPDKRKKPWKDVMAKANVVPAEPLKPAAVRARVRDEVRRRRLPLDDEAVQALIDMVGQDLRRLMGELEKLEAYAEGRQGNLTAEDIEAVLGRGIGQPLYKMSDALAARRPAEVLALLEVALDEGTPSLVVLSALHRALRQVRAAAAMRAARMSPDAIAARLLPPHMKFKIDSLLMAARAWPDEDLRAAVAALDRADRRIKNSADARAALQVAVAEACGGGNGPGARPGARTGR
jgi:DNA polymerase-3 subunit delta